MYLNKKMLQEYMKVAAKVVSKNTISVLGMYRLEFDSVGLEVYATDLKTIVRKKIPYISGLMGIVSSFDSAFLVSATALKAIVDSCGTEITVRYDSGTVYFDETPVPVNGSVDKYPERVFDHDDQSHVDGKITEVEKLVHLNKFISDDVARYFMNGVYFEYDSGVLKCTATDGRVLCHMPAGTLSDECPGVIVPGIQFLNHTKDTEVSFSIFYPEGSNKRYIIFRTAYFDLIVTEIDGQFPNYTRVIPETGDHTISVDGQAMLDFFAAAKQKVLISGNRWPSEFRVRVHFKGARADIHAGDEQYPIGSPIPDMFEKMFQFGYLRQLFWEPGEYSICEADRSYTAVRIEHSGMLMVAMGMVLD